ncbi:MAG: hypothetical protein N7Q72_02375 [Spiroplasma sp. Tabriz.8]|nr:hypothetical protein [Spiroplasma sp. Tabriz.8]
MLKYIILIILFSLNFIPTIIIIIIIIIIILIFIFILVIITFFNPTLFYCIVKLR